MEQGSATRRAGERLRARFDAPFRAPWLRRLGWHGEDLGSALRNTFESELAERVGFHWLAVGFGFGAVVYFLLPREPTLFALAAGATIFGGAAIFGYRRGVTWRALSLIAVVLAGATVAKFRVDSLVQPEITRPTFATLNGRVLVSESRIDLRPRIVLGDVRSAMVPPEAMPGSIRLSIADRHGLPPLGSRIALNARLMPVPGAVVPGGYDPHRAAFFEGIGASGFALGGWTLATAAPRFSTDLAVGAIRAAIVARIMAAEPGEAGAVASALLVGERSALSEETNENLRISGLFHILSISGLHMMLVGGTVFFTIRALLAISPQLALRRPIRKWSAVAALLALALYFALSGGGAATLRAYVMALILFAAILVDRPAISMRNLAIAAFVVIAFEPEGVMEPGFQMSFAAVMALIAAWEVWRDRRTARLTDDDVIPGFWLLRKTWRAILAVAVTTLVAGLATGPFAAYHFERIATYSLLGNLLAAPLVSLIIMPFGLLSLAVMPLGLESFPLAVMAWGIELLLEIAAFVASLPGGDVRAPQISAASLALFAAGMLWLCLWRRRWRFFGLPVVFAAFASIPLLADPPDMLVAPDGKAVAVRDAEGVLRVSGARAGSYTVEQFFDEEGDEPTSATALRAGVRCDAAACLLADREGRLVSHVLDPAAFSEDCWRVPMIVTSLTAPADCPAPLIIDAPRLVRLGAHAVRVTSGTAGPDFRVTTELSVNPRPWQGRGGAAAP